ncbi:MAG TPA: ABC transporter permease [Gammaproteobacteria bacterium]|jgi:ABC-2 type transport system permease protein|nr:ABC transporter permease [Gammaproteobacteria bacterium]
MNLHAQYIAFKTIVIKEFLRFTRIWIQTVLPPAITMVLYFIIFGNLIGSQIGDIHGFAYMQYIVPGLIMLGIIANSYANVVSSFFSAKFQRHIEEMLVSPTPNYIILLGFMSGGMIRGLTVGCMVFLISLLFTHLQVHNLFVTISVVVLTAMLFSLAGFINGVFAKSFDDISIVPTFVLTPLTYLGGIFYSIDMLSPFWRQVSMFNPILYMINAFRYGILGISDINVLTSFAIIIGFIVALFTVGLRLLDKGVGIRT